MYFVLNQELKSSASFVQTFEDEPINEIDLPKIIYQNEIIRLREKSIEYQKVSFRKMLFIKLIQYT